MATDVTYLFFQRDQRDDGGDFDIDSSPSIQSARVVRHGGGLHSRAGSVPPAALLRAGSVPPRSVRAGSVTPRGGILIATATPQRSPIGGIGAPSGSTSSVRHIIHRPPLQSGASGSRGVLTSRGVIAGSSRFDDESENAGGGGSGGLLSSHRAPPPPHGVRRSSITVATATPAELQQRSRANRDLMIYRAEDFTSGNRHGPGTPLTTGSSSASRTTFRSTSSGEPASSLRSSYRRASVSGPPSSKVYPRINDDLSKSTYQINVNGDVETTTTTTTKKSTAADETFEIPARQESVAGLRTRMNLAREQMSQHRVLLDRYLPVNLGPSNEVQYEVENKVNELAYRMPQLDATKRAIRSFDNDDVKTSRLVTPYTPLPRTTKIEVSPMPPLRSSFTPKISDVRKRARSVLCKVKGDPRYFDF